MLKKLIIAIFCVLPLSVFAQGQLKFGNINTNELFELMPEKITVQKEIEALSKKYEGELVKMKEEYQRKVQDFVAQQDTLPENIKMRRAQEIQELEQRVQNFQQVAMQDVEQNNRTKIAPVIKKVTEAIKAVGQENGFTYIFDLTNPGILFHSTSQTIDVTPLVKTKLGLK